jgi:hypothetical protein
MMQKHGHHDCTVKWSNAVALSFFVLCTSAAAAQSPLALRNVGNGAAVSAAAFGANNPWIGAQMFYRVPTGAKGGFGEHLLPAGNLMYEIQLGANKLHLPVMGNLAPIVESISKGASKKDSVENQIKQLLSSESGGAIGLFPYRVIAESKIFMLTVNAIAAWRINGLHPVGRPGGSASTSDSTVYLNQLRFGAGLESIIGERGSGHGVLTLSVTPVGTFFDSGTYEQAFGSKKGKLFGVELGGILPLREGVGFLIEGVLGEASVRAFRAGLVAAGQPK